MSRLSPTIRILTFTLVGIGVILGAHFGLNALNPNVLKALFTAHPKPEKKVDPVVVDLGERTVNLSDTATAHFLKITLSVQMTGHGDAAKVMEVNHAKLIDAEVMVTTRYSYNELLTEKGKQDLKDQLLRRFNENLASSGWAVSDVMLTDFVME